MSYTVSTATVEYNFQPDVGLYVGSEEYEIVGWENSEPLVVPPPDIVGIPLSVVVEERSRSKGWHRMGRHEIS